MKQLNYSPYDLLPIQNPKDYTPEDNFFYENVVKYLIPDVLTLMYNGIPIDLDRVRELETTVVSVLDNVKQTLSNNFLIKDFLKEKYSYLINKKTEEILSKQKTYKSYLQPFNIKNTVHCTFVINTFLLSDPKYKEYLKLDKSNWKIKELQKLNSILKEDFITKLLDKDYDYINNHEITATAMKALAEQKAIMFNNKQQNKANSVQENTQELEFNPNSPKQLQEFFTYLGIISENLTPSGNPSYDRNVLENIHYQVKDMLREFNKEI